MYKQYPLRCLGTSVIWVKKNQVREDVKCPLKQYRITACNTHHSCSLSTPITLQPYSKLLLGQKQTQPNRSKQSYIYICFTNTCILTDCIDMPVISTGATQYLVYGWYTWASWVLHHMLPAYYESILNYYINCWMPRYVAQQYKTHYQAISVAISQKTHMQVLSPLCHWEVD